MGAYRAASARRPRASNEATSSAAGAMRENPFAASSCADVAAEPKDIDNARVGVRLDRSVHERRGHYVHGSRVAIDGPPHLIVHLPAQVMPLRIAAPIHGRNHEEAQFRVGDRGCRWARVRPCRFRPLPNHDSHQDREERYRDELPQPRSGTPWSHGLDPQRGDPLTRCGRRRQL